MFICEKLGWRSLAEMREGLSAEERLLWAMFFARKNQHAELQAKLHG